LLEKFVGGMMSKLFLVSSLLLVPKFASATLTSAEKTNILNKHNELRAAIANPCTATDMETLVWDDTLATQSQTWADACVGDHDPKAAIDFGENLWMLTNSKEYSSADLTKAVQEWYDEIKDVEWQKDAAGEYSEAKSKAGTKDCASPDAANGNCFIGHFTQVVWAKSNKVGCGVKKCSPMTVSGGKYPNGALLVCRYLPAGNKAAKKDSPNHVTMPFVAGKKGAACSGTMTTAGLCNAGTKPTRCADKAAPYNLNGKDLATCAAYVGGVSAMLGKTADADVKHACTVAAVASMIDGFCDAYCGKCTAPSGVGKAHCGASSGGGSTTGASKTTGTTGESKTTGTTGTTGASKTTGTTGGSKTTGTTGTTGAVTPAAKALKITGDVTLKLADADAFLADADAKDAVQDGIATSMGVTKNQVVAVFTKARRLSVERHLAGTSVKVAYTITVPASAGTAAHAAIQTKANTATAAKLTTAIAAKVTAAKGNSYTVSVDSMSEPSGKPKATVSSTIGMQGHVWSFLATLSGLFLYF